MYSVLDCRDFLALVLLHADTGTRPWSEIVETRFRLQKQLPGVVVDLSGSSLGRALTSSPELLGAENSHLSRGPSYAKVFSQDAFRRKFASKGSESTAQKIIDIVADGR